VYGAADIDFALRESGDDISLGSTTVPCLLDTPEALGIDVSGIGGVVGAKIGALIRTGTLPGLAIGSLVVVDGVNHFVRLRERIEDGSLTVLLLSRNAPPEGEDGEIPASWVGNDAPLLLHGEAAGLPNALVLEGSDSVHVDRSTPGILRLSAADGTQLTETMRLVPEGGYTEEQDTYAGLLPTRPANPLDVVLFHAGVGTLVSVDHAPASGEFRIVGEDLTDVVFGRRPKPGAVIHAFPHLRA
jgi:hypothetical protein